MAFGCSTFLAELNVGSWYRPGVEDHSEWSYSDQGVYLTARKIELGFRRRPRPGPSTS